MMRTTGCTGCLDAIQSKALCLWVNIVTSNISLISTKQAHHQPQGLTTVFFRTCYRGTTLLNLLFWGRNCHLCRLRLLAFSSWVSITRMNPLPGYSSIPNLTCSVLEGSKARIPRVRPRQWCHLNVPVILTHPRGQNHRPVLVSRGSEFRGVVNLTEPRDTWQSGL